MPASEIHKNGGGLRELARNYLSALLDKDRQRAERLIMDAMKDGVSIREIYLTVFQPVQWEIGRLWQSNMITVAMEHYCTAATQFVMSRLYDHIFSTEKIGRNLVATSISGELHELGIRMVSDFFEMEGWNTYYLGANTPAESVVTMINETKADILAISATIYFNTPQVKELIEYVKARPHPDHMKIMVGGKAFNAYSNLWQDSNADGYATDADGAVREANRLLKIS